MIGYTPSDGTMDRFIKDNLLDAQFALINARSRRQKYGSAPVVVDTNPRHNKTSNTYISMSDYDQNNASEVIVFGTTGNDKFANHGAYSLIWGDKGNDSIRSYNSDVTIAGGGGNDSIRISVSSFALSRNSLSGGDGDDTIAAYKSGGTSPNEITIMGGKGDDIINLTYRSYYDNGTYRLQYSPGDGNDVVNYWNKTRDVLYIAGSDYQTEGSGDDMIVHAGNGSIRFNDFRALHGNDARIKIETVPAGTFGATTSGGGTSTGSGGGSTTSGGSKGLTLTNTTSNRKITGTSYADSIFNSVGADKVTISTGKGNDTLNNFGDTIRASMGAGNDYVYSYSYYSTINPGTGNDTVSLSSSGHHNVIEYAAGDGNDLIYNLGSTDTLSITGGSYTRSTLSHNVIITVGPNKITLVGANGNTINIKGTKASSSSSSGSGSGKYSTNYSSNKKIIGTSYADTVYNYGSKVSVNGGKGNDYLVSFEDGSKVTLAGGAGNDSISSWSAYSRIDGGDGADNLYAGTRKSTVLGGAGNDSIQNYGSYNSILGGAGNDTIINTSLGNYSTLNGGAGNDIIEAGGASKTSLLGGAGNDSLWGGYGNDTFIFRAGEGTDKIFDYSSGDMLKILKSNGKTGSFSKSKYSGGTLSLTISGGGQILFDDVSRSETFNINNTSYKISGSKLVKK